MHKRLLGIVFTFALAPLLAGCPDTEGELCNFDDRHKVINFDGEGVGTCENVTAGTGGAAACTNPPVVGEVDGDYMFTLSTSLDPNKPLLFNAAITLVDGADGGFDMTMLLHPLDGKDRTTRVGKEQAVQVPMDAGGAFSVELPEIFVPGLGNPISGGDVSAKVTMAGAFCKQVDDFSCGTINGDAIVAGSTLPINGSNWTIEQGATAGTYPDPPKLDCDGTEAPPAAQ